MAFKSIRKWQSMPIAWLILTILLAFGAGYCIASYQKIWTLFAFCALGSGYMLMSRISRLRERIRYVIQASLSKDFSYKFPTTDVNKEERDINEMLNKIVEHLELITLEARQNEAFLERVINLTDIGLALADANGNIRLHNEAALHLLERSALTHTCQIPPQAFSELAIKRSSVTVNDKSFTLFTISDLSRQMQAKEVESWEKLTRVLTHEIMNSLTPIQSIAESMSEKTSTPEAADAFNTISSSSRSLMEFVKNSGSSTVYQSPRSGPHI